MGSQQKSQQQSRQLLQQCKQPQQTKQSLDINSSSMDAFRSSPRRQTLAAFHKSSSDRSSKKPVISFPSDTKEARSTNINNRSTSEFLVGDRVRARFGTWGPYYAASIDKINDDGTLAIAYDDGDYLSSLSKRHVQKLFDAEYDDDGGDGGGDGDGSGYENNNNTIKHEEFPKVENRIQYNKDPRRQVYLIKKNNNNIEHQHHNARQNTEDESVSNLNFTDCVNEKQSLYPGRSRKKKKKESSSIVNHGAESSDSTMSETFQSSVENQKLHILPLIPKSVRSLLREESKTFFMDSLYPEYINETLPSPKFPFSSNRIESKKLSAVEDDEGDYEGGNFEVSRTVNDHMRLLN